MKSILMTYLLFGALFSSVLSNSQNESNHSGIKTKKEINMDTINDKPNKEYVSLIDKFFVPKNSISEFILRMDYNRSFIKNLAGLIKSEAYKQQMSKVI